MIDPVELGERVGDYAALHTPALGGGRAVLAVSGGGDSIATAALLCETGVIDPCRSVVAHFDHRLRGPAAAVADRAAVEALCARYGLPLEAGAWDGPRPGEAAARDARYRFLVEVARRNNIRVIVTGHTSDDQVDTVIMNTLRGAGLHGLRGMQPQRELAGDLQLVRPMLCVSREETRGYCAARGLRYQDDASNEDQAYLRNRVRLDLLPRIEAAVPGVRGAILRLADEARANVTAIASMAETMLDVAVLETHGEYTVLSRERLTAVPPALAPHVWRLAIARLLGDARDFHRYHYDVLVRATSAATGSAFELPRGLRLTVDADAVVLSRGAIVSAAVPDEVTGELPFEGVLGEWRIDVAWADDAAGGVPAVVLPVGAIVRGRRPGDRIQPRGMRGHKKLQDYYVDKKIPRRERDAAPVIACGADVLWTPFGLAEPAPGGVRFRVDATRASDGGAVPLT